VLPDLYHLADTDYANKHRYFVDGTPEVGDICPGAPSTNCTADDWRTIIVGGLNQGGKSFYALDITDPASPHLLWEFTNTQLGYSYSNPRITKLKDGTWAVIVASGYNNTDGVGRLFILNASTGALINTITTGVGTSSDPAGLTKLSARAPNSSVDNTVEEVYGGDLLGNVWRFDVNNMVGKPGADAQLLVQLQDPSGNAQPITAKPTVASVGSSPLVIVGTGRYLGLTDLTDTSTYSMYAIKDKLDSTTLPTPRSTGSKFVQQTMVDSLCPTGAPDSICTQGQVVRTTSANPVDWGVDNGWYVDFIIGGERAVTDPTLALGTLVFTTVKPQSSTTGTIIGCTGNDTAVNAKSYLYYLDYLTGGAVEGTGNVAGEELCTCIATRPSVVKTQNGNVEGIIRMSGGGTSEGTDMGVTNRQDLPYSSSGSPARRISWRVLNGD
jgi:type IV pilus assembly protein PilY1